MIKRAYVFIFLCFFLLMGCSKNGSKNYISINGYDSLKWNMNVEEIKKVINKKYSGNLYEYFTQNSNNSISYHFHSGSFFDKNIELWDAEFKDKKFISLKIFFKPENKAKVIFKSILDKLNKQNIKFEEKKQNSILCTFFTENSDKPVTKLTLETKKIKKTEVVLLTLINLN
ncbi:MAG: hypothetical protein V1773_03850 [bacterium]